MPASRSARPRSGRRCRSPWRWGAVGKQLGVFGAMRGAVALGLARKPWGASWAQLYGVALLAGIGFTMSLFIGGLAFRDPILVEEVKVGVLAGSALSALAGFAVLRLASARR